MAKMSLIPEKRATVSPGTPDELARADYVLYAVAAGKADALLLKTGSRFWLIDAGYARSRGKLLYAMELLGAERLDGVFVTHGDADHTDGLRWLAESSIPVGGWYAPAFSAETKEGKHPADRAAALRGETVTRLREGDRFELGEAVLEVLSPDCLIKDKDDNNSLVLRLQTPCGSMLLCGDMEYRQEERLLKSSAELRCDVLKIPNHGDNDVCSREFLLAATPAVSVISTDTREKPGTPDPGLMKRLKQVCGTVLQTQYAEGGAAVALLPGEILTAYVPLPRAAEGVAISDAEGGEITLTNSGRDEIDLSDWYLLSDKKNSCFVLPEDTVLAPGQSLTVGGDREKKPFGKKMNTVTLYDRWGNRISRKGPGTDK